VRVADGGDDGMVEVDAALGGDGNVAAVVAGGAVAVDDDVAGGGDAAGQREDADGGAVALRVVHARRAADRVERARRRIGAEDGDAVDGEEVDEMVGGRAARRISSDAAVAAERRAGDAEVAPVDVDGLAGADDHARRGAAVRERGHEAVDDDAAALQRYRTGARDLSLRD